MRFDTSVKTCLLTFLRVVFVLMALATIVFTGMAYRVPVVRP